ncbi:MAG: hypothetical protein HC851_11050 [Acaryochloris sp. RU_4_1]|nr:hypothetical protein [Acaryochloris sp. RU_4_1]NJR54805.1 hypothetical protein [Acaryochloris sp. CRU_2_0]
MLCRFSRIQILVAVRGIFAGAVAASTMHLMTGNALTQAQIAGTVQRSNLVIAGSQLSNLNPQIGICQPHLLPTASQQGSGGISTGHSSQIRLPIGQEP